MHGRPWVQEVSYAELERNPGVVVESPAFMEKVRAFQASNAHPYARHNVSVSQVLPHEMY